MTERLTRTHVHIQGFPGGASGKEQACRRRYKGRGFNPWVRKIPWKRAWQHTSVFFPGGSHGQRSLAGYSAWDCKRVGHDVATKPYHHCPSEPKVDGSASPWVKLHLILILVVSDPEQSPLLHPPLWDLPGGSRLFSQPGLNADAQPGLSLALPEAP